MKIFLIKDGKEAGPFTPQQVQKWVIQRVVSPINFAWREGLEKWVPVSTLLSKKIQKKLTDKIKYFWFFINKNGNMGMIFIFLFIITVLLSVDTYFRFSPNEQQSDSLTEYWRNPQVYEYQHDGVDYVLAETRFGVGICPKSFWKGVRITATNTVENLPLPEIALEEYQPKDNSE